MSRKLYCMSLVASALLLACIGSSLAMAKERISNVTKVGATIEKKEPPIFVVTAEGETGTPNWTDPELKLIQDDPVDGIYMTEFIANPPGGGGAQIEVMTPIGPVELRIESKAGAMIKGVEVKAQTNCILYIFTDEVLANPDKCDVIAAM